MIVCICKNISDREIESAISKGQCGNLKEVCGKLGVAQQCGKCAGTAKHIVKNSVSCTKSKH